ncbi:holliday junction resolvase GEN1/YEN1 [Marchantia polymorpha subsp. ruderalis]|uniref:XPG-I domain-containing protein n=2 Tax=Marchantia polymorpha TaxID=3197 RepID=A0AAF6AXB6_MARPO|nr:hypothetical protein MARPO_0022s0105 [Marchantia polymorpha]BBN04400.1 hypothetical protein Mp_3g04260 [Marchantia polymorpha subsp. ruderalis]|eukprot:PTQ44004.1 hypothetical protein MARPO_0022s0105 [Marchantia polymorpha]
MGVGKGFWEQLRPLARTEDLSFLRGKRLAVDLSYWLVQQQTALKDHRVRKPHLRLTFFRVVKLVAKVGALPVFVVDGEPPALKQGVRMKRFKRFSSLCPPSPPHSPATTESVSTRNGSFSANVEECVILLELLGMPVLRAEGEAESLCAILNREGLVDACVSPDSDVFVHGAKWVIKTLQLDNKSKESEVELYRAEDIEASMGLRRNHLVALALLIGCDYMPEGVAGVGCANAFQLIRSFPESEILDRLRAWGRGEGPSEGEIEQGAQDDGSGREPSVAYDSEVQIRVTHCSKCGHPGNKKEHLNSGCGICFPSREDEYSFEKGCKPKPKGFLCSCPFCSQKARSKLQTKANAWWGKMCSKMAATPGFPNEEIIKIFLNSEIPTFEDVTGYASSIKWHAPAMDELEMFLQKHLSWDSFYVRQKALPLLSHFYLSDLADKYCKSSEELLNGAFAPLCIHRIKIEHGEPLYVLKWKNMREGVDGEQWLGLKLNSTSPKHIEETVAKECRTDNECVDLLSTEATEKEWCFTTDESMESIKAACPELVEEFDRSQEAKQAARKKASKRKKVEGIESAKRQSDITSFFKVEHDLHKNKLTESPQFERKCELGSPHTLERTAAGLDYIDTEALVASLNSNSKSTTFSSTSPPLTRTRRRSFPTKVVRKLSYGEGAG